jgi:DNA polymerase sigma
MAALKHNKLLVEHQLIAAKVPILRIKCEEGVFSDIMVDLNVNNAVAIRNTHLLCYYSACKSTFCLSFELVNLNFKSIGEFVPL